VAVEPGADREIVRALLPAQHGAFEQLGAAPTEADVGVFTVPEDGLSELAGIGTLPDARGRRHPPRLRARGIRRDVGGAGLRAGVRGPGHYPGTLMAANPRVTPELSRDALEGTFPGDLGIELVEIGDDRVVGRLAVDRRHLHPGGYVHGGVWTAFADTVAAWGTMRRLPQGEDFTTVELKVNVFAAGREGDELIGIGEPLHVGRRTQVWEVRVHNGERLAANFVCTQMVLPGRP
jgi:uncharacterized protein (TIGR00369 family)